MELFGAVRSNMSQGHETGVKREDAINPPSDAGREVGGDDEGSQQAEEYVDVEDEAKIRGVYRYVHFDTTAPLT